MAILKKAEELEMNLAAGRETRHLVSFVKEARAGLIAQPELSFELLAQVAMLLLLKLRNKKNADKSLKGRRETLNALQSAEKRIQQAIVSGTEKALLIVQAKALTIIDEEMYDRPKGPFYIPATGHLRESFITQLADISGSITRGYVGNTAEYAPFLEYGTGLYGPEAREIVIHAINAKMLHFVDEYQGEMFRDHVTIAGIEPFHFMMRALEDNKTRDRVLSAYKEEIQSAIK